jgi:methylated-DNA-[protein]-cysteine S-methyltransferase
MFPEKTVSQAVNTQMIDVYTKNIGGVWFGAACSEQRVFSTAFANSQKEALRKLLRSIPFSVPFQVHPEPSAFAETVLNSLKNTYDGNSVPQNVPLATEHLSAYTQKVLKTASLIPAGYVASYGAIAKAAGGNPRSVGRVMASNPFAPIVPCHRVVSSDCTLGGYGGGLTAKLEFLIREKRGYTSAREIAMGDKKLQVFPVEHVLRKLGKE